MTTHCEPWAISTGPKGISIVRSWRPARPESPTRGRRKSRHLLPGGFGRKVVSRPASARGEKSCDLRAIFAECVQYCSDQGRWIRDDLLTIDSRSIFPLQYAPVALFHRWWGRCSPFVEGSFPRQRRFAIALRLAVMSQACRSGLM
jgi:hypothetical protein